MASAPKAAPIAKGSTEPAAAEHGKERVRREIPGNLPYLTSPGALKNVLGKIITASVPDKFSQDYLSTILGYSGGSYRQVIPILKRIGLLSGDGKPTELYSRFRPETGRAMAVYAALRTGFSELFKRNEHVYAASDQKLTDLIVEVTGLPKTDQIVSAIKSTFKVLSGYLPQGFSPSEADPIGAATAPAREDEESSPGDEQGEHHRQSGDHSKLNLAYNINIVLPDTKDIETFNAIFRSIRENLLR